MARFIPHFKSDQPDPVFLHRLALIQSVCLIAVGLIAVLSLCARLIPGLRGHTPDGSIMRSGSALAALLSAMSLTLSQPRRSSRMWLASVLCAVMAALIAANTLILTVRFNSSGLNGFFLVNRGESLLPGMSPAIATAFLLLAVVMVLIRERRRYPSNLADLLTFCLCLLVMVLASAFVFGILGIFLFMPNDSVSPLALLCLVLLTFVAAGRRAENGIFTILLGAGLGSKIARLFFPVIVLLPFVREIARARAIQAGLLRSGYASAVATSLAAVFAFSLLLIMAWRMNTLEREVRELSLRDELCGALQAAEKLDFDLFCNKGTTLVGPQMQQNKGWALAPAAFLHHNRQYFGRFSAACESDLFSHSRSCPSHYSRFNSLRRL
jgi:hypothetical protein